MISRARTQHFLESGGREACFCWRETDFCFCCSKGLFAASEGCLSQTFLQSQCRSQKSQRTHETRRVWGVVSFWVLSLQSWPKPHIVNGLTPCLSWWAFQNAGKHLSLFGFVKVGNPNRPKKPFFCFCMVLRGEFLVSFWWVFGPLDRTQVTTRKFWCGPGRSGADP